MSLKVEIHTHPSTAVLKLSGELTAVNQNTLTNAMKPLLEGAQTRIVLDMTEVPFIGSTGLGELVKLVAQVNSQGGRVVLAGLTPFVADVLDTTKLNRFFEISDTPEAAMARLG